MSIQPVHRQCGSSDRCARGCSCLRAPDSATPLSAQLPSCCSGPPPVENSQAPAAWRWGERVRGVGAASYPDLAVRCGACWDGSSARRWPSTSPAPQSEQLHISYCTPFSIVGPAVPDLPRAQSEIRQLNAGGFDYPNSIGLMLIRSAALNATGILSDSRWACYGHMP